MENKKTEKVEETKVPKKEVKPKVDYKAENKKLQEEIKNLSSKVDSLTMENQINMIAFQEKAKTFQEKAQVEINKFKEEFETKNSEEQVEFKKYASQKLFESIIQPLINIEIAIKSGKTQGSEVSAYVAGFDMLMNQLFTELESFGLTKIIPNIGDTFEPELHEAFATAEGKENSILDVKKNGFKLNERVIQPAIVVIGG